MAQIYTYVYIWATIKLGFQGSEEYVVVVVCPPYLLLLFNPCAYYLPIVMELNLFDCLRANKSTQAWGLEVRVPFLDADFLDVSMVWF